MKFSSSGGICDVCGKSRGGRGHEVCSKKKQKAHAGENHPRRKFGPKKSETLGTALARKGI